MKKIVALFLSLFIGGCATQAFAFGKKHPTAVAIDTVTESTAKDNDVTGLAEGCGQQPSPLGMFCHVEEGSAADKVVWFIGPPAQCEREACVYIKIINSQGQIVAGPSIPKGKTRVAVPWSTLLSRDTFQIGDRGTWTFITTVYYVDKDGREHKSDSLGDIILRVFRQGYVPLHNVKSDPNFVWTWSEGPVIYRMTSGLRAYVGKVVR